MRSEISSVITRIILELALTLTPAFTCESTDSERYEVLEHAGLLLSFFQQILGPYFATGSGVIAGNKKQ
jgi:hypothetical protein